MQKPELPDVEFGKGGWVDLTEGLRLAEDRDLDIGLNAPPLVVGDVIVVGAAHDIGSRPPLMRNVKGDVRGFDARTGELLWTFHTIPEPDEPGYETWYDGSADYTGNAGVWAPMSADPELGLVFLPVEAPTGDYYGGPRHGANLYANCLVALDVVSGEMRWYYQLIHHDIWDWDNPTAPILADLPNGRKLAVQVTKQNYAYVFDRKTGEPVWPIQERPVPQSDVPGEWTSPTQPFPTKPAPYDRQGLSRDDLIAYTPEISAAVDEAIADYRLSPSLYTPSSLSNAPDGTKGTLGSAVLHRRREFRRQRLRSTNRHAVRTVGYLHQGVRAGERSRVVRYRLYRRRHFRTDRIRPAHYETAAWQDNRHRSHDWRSRLDDR